MTSWARRLPLEVDRRAWLRLLALLIALVAALPLMQEGALLNTRGGGDSPFLLQRVQQLTRALADGHFPVRWMPDAAYGYGYPFFNYYAPLSIYVAVLFRFLGASYTSAIQFSQLTAFLLAAWAMFELARRWLYDDWAALLASAAYTLAPFHLVNIYVRGDSLAEFWAMALYPVVLLAAHCLLRPEKPCAISERAALPLTRIAALALSYAALILSHNISALIFSPFLLLYMLIAALQRRATLRRALLEGGMALLLGLLLSAWFWLPALAETDLVQTGPVTAGYFYYGNHFRGADLVQPSFFFDWEVAGQTAFRMGLVQALLIVAGLVVLLWRAASRPALIFTVAVLAVATLMITPLSRWLWDTLPLLPYTQFPWRFLSVQALAGALITGALALLPGRRLWALMGSVLLLAAMLPSLDVDHVALADADVTPHRLAQYEWFTGNIGTTVSAEYLPRAVQPRPYSSAWLTNGERHAPQVLAGDASVQLVSHRATRQRWQVDVSTGPALVQFPTLYWPGWQARAQGQPLAISATPGSGLISAELPAGDYTLELSLGRTPVRLAAELLSLAAALALLLWVARSASAQAVDFWRRRRVSLLAFVALLLVLALYWRLWPTPDYEQHTLSWDFAQLGYLHHAPQGILFGDGSRLAQYDYSASTVAAGDTVHITLQWQNVAANSPTATLALATPAVHRAQHAPLLVAEEQPAAQGSVSYELPVPANAPPGLYVPRLGYDGAEALTPSGEPRGALFLRPLRVVSPHSDAQPDRSLDVRADDVVLPQRLPVSDDGATGLFDCASGQSSPGALHVKLAWLTRQPLGANLTASLRLDDAGGRRLAQCDMQPGYGFLPSVAWQPGVWIPDRLALPLPPALPPSPHYVLFVTLYDAGGNQALTHPLGRLQWQEETLVYHAHEPQFSLPADVEPLHVRFGEHIALRGYHVTHGDDALQLTLYWQALETIQDDYVRFVHLLANENGAPLAQQDGAPQNDTYPTGQWTEGEVVADTVTLDTMAPAGGDALIAAGFYPSGEPEARLPAYDEQGNSLTDGRVLITISRE